MKKTLLTFFALAVALAAAAESFKSNGFVFEIESRAKKTVSVVGLSQPTADMEVPATVDYEGDTYSVIEIYHLYPNADVLRTLTIGDNVQTVDGHALEFCSNMQKYIVSPGNMYLKADDCGVLYDAAMQTLIAYPLGRQEKDYVIPDGVKIIGNAAFYTDEGLQTLENLTVPSSVTHIKGMAFSKCKSITSLDLPGVIEIGDCCFIDNYNLKSVTFGDRLEKISPWAFLECKSLEEVHLPGSLRYLGDTAFGSCRNLTTLTIDEGLKEIPYYAFSNCPIKKINLPNSIETIGPWAFVGNNATEITFGNSLKTLGNSAFSSSNKVKEIILPNSLNEIEEEAFRSCQRLKKVVLGNAVKKIRDSAFEGCVSLKEIKLPNSITDLGNRTFANCFEIENITLPENITAIGNGLFSVCRNLQEIKIPESVTSIGDNAFAYCYELKEVTIPNKVKTIGDEVFMVCDLISITLGTGLESMGYKVFEGNNNLTTINTLATTPPELDDTFEDFENLDNCTLKVPAGSEAAYQKADGWKEFKTTATLTDQDIEALGIETLTQNPTLNTKNLYNLQGQKVGEDYKGIVIQGGKKVLKK